MKYPEVCLLPFLMVADYVLTIAGARLKDKKYGDHFKSPHYELNPMFQKVVAEKKWLCPRHVGRALLATALLAVALELGGVPEWFAEGLLGCVLVSFGIVIGRHLSNIAVFRYVAARPEEIAGEITMAHAMVLVLSTCQYLGVAVPVALLAVFCPTPFVIGGLLGTLQLLVKHALWLRQHVRQAKKDSTTN